MTNTITKETIINEIINIFKNNTDLFNDCIEQLDNWNGYLNDDRFYSMDEIDEILCDKKPSEIMYMTFFGHDLDGYTTDINGCKHYCEFNPNSDYFRFNGYGNLVSTNYIDYSDHIDSYAIEALCENRTEIDAIETDDKLIELFDKLEEA